MDILQSARLPIIAIFLKQWYSWNWSWTKHKPR